MVLKELFDKQGTWLFRYRGTIPLIVLVVGVYVFIQSRMEWCPWFPTYIWTGSAYTYFCLLVSLLGLAVRVMTVGYTPANTSGRNVTGQVADTLNTTGLYSVVRNPLYLGNFLMWLGIGLLTADLWFIVAFVLFYWIYYERIIYTEEQYLTQKFGQVYTDWADRTPCFIPRMHGYVKPSLPFSWKKVFKKEKNGLLALFLVFTAFDLLGVWLFDERPEIPVWIVTAFSVILYCVLKYIKHRTNWLDEEGR